MSELQDLIEQLKTAKQEDIAYLALQIFVLGQSVGMENTLKAVK